MKPKIFDIHSHLNFNQFNGDRENVIKQMQDQGIWTICIGTDKKTSQEVVDLVDKYENIYASIGTHPTDTDEDWDKDYYLDLSKNKKVVAIGECGLDYFHMPDDSQQIEENKKIQKDLFKKHIELAIELDKPLIIHCRDSHEDVLEILNMYSDPKLRGDIHFFSGDLSQAEKYLQLGFVISFAGPVTFTNAYDEVVEGMSIDDIMIETDSPFAAPAPYRGKRAEPLHVIEVAKKISEIKRMSLKEVLEKTTQNALDFFSI